MKQRKISISAKLLLTILPLLFLAVVTSVYVNNVFQEEEMLKQAQVSAQTYGDIIRESLVNMMISRQQVDDEYLRHLNNMPDIQNLAILFNTDNLHLRDEYQSDQRMERLRLREQKASPVKPEEQEVFRSGKSFLKLENNRLSALVPFEAGPRCQQCHDVPANHVLGVARMEISMERISASINNNWIRSFWISLIFILIAILASVIVYKIVVAQRLKQLIDATKVIGTGNLNKEVTLGDSRDDLGDLAGAIDSMRVQLKKAQEGLIHSERLSTIGQMASSIIHDFRAPMTTINLAVQSLQQQKDFSNEKTEQWYKLIREAIARMVTMAQELLDFSRGESHLDKQEYDMDEFMHLLERSISTNLERANVKLTIDKHCSGNASFDGDRLHRALVNIINNAQDAMPHGGTLLIQTVRNNGTVSFSIKDSGSGIPSEIREKMFDAFVTFGKKRGTGLGLAITKRIIDQHGGMIEVQSEQGKGTTFVVSIPA